MPAHLSARPPVSIPALDAFQLQLTPFNSTPTSHEQAWTRLCKCLGQDFIPYLQVVMPPLLKSAQVKPDVQVTDVEDGAEDDEDEDVEVITVSGAFLVSSRRSPRDRVGVVHAVP